MSRMYSCKYLLYQATWIHYTRLRESIPVQTYLVQLRVWVSVMSRMRDSSFGLTFDDFLLQGLPADWQASSIPPTLLSHCLLRRMQIDASSDGLPSPAYPPSPWPRLCPDCRNWIGRIYEQIYEFPSSPPLPAHSYVLSGTAYRWLIRLYGV